LKTKAETPVNESKDTSNEKKRTRELKEAMALQLKPEPL